jgi:hypothetical protein
MSCAIYRCSGVAQKKARPSKTPKRVKPALDLLAKMIGRHGSCSYGALRDISCPSKVKRSEQEAALDSSVILVCPFIRL